MKTHYGYLHNHGHGMFSEIPICGTKSSFRWTGLKKHGYSKQVDCKRCVKKFKADKKKESTGC